MPIIIKTRRELEMMRRAGQIGSQILAKVRDIVAPGVTTAALNEMAARELSANDAVGTSKNYPTYRPGEGFPAETCISVNEVVVHGIPGARVLKEGDIVTIDLALMVNGYCADTAITVPVGKVTPEIRKLLDVTRQTLDLAIEQVRPGQRWSNVARLMQHMVETNGFNVVREFVGHGVGKTMHEDPKVPNFTTGDQPRGDFELRPGMTLAIEPMVVMGRRQVEVLRDGWTVVTKDRMPAAHFEHTVAVTETGADVLTDGRAPNE